MRISAALSFTLQALATANLFRQQYPSYNASGTTVDHALAGSQIAAAKAWNGFELRQELGDALAVPVDVAVPGPTVNPAPPMLDPVVLPANPAAPIDPVAAPIDPIVPPAVTSTTPPIVTSNLLASSSSTDDSITTQWLETWIGGTSQTWIPKTVVFRFHTMSPGPLPGKGEIGMGTLTGDTGKTQTVMGAAPSQAVPLVRGYAVAVGVGVAGLMR